jgi:uncharacterized protein with ParB-like and HNH nuclease domain
MASISLTELFNTRVFRIPDYQRGYAWGDKQLNELWDDIDEIQQVNGVYKKHYTGTVYLEKTKPEESEEWISNVEFYNIVDGQQRLTTISILLFELLKATRVGYAEKKIDKLYETFIFESNLSGQSRVYKFGYSSRSKNYQYLLHTIFEDEKIIPSQENFNHYLKNLLNAKQFFQRQIEKIDDLQRDVLFRKITTALQFDLRTIEKDLDVQAVFETMNNRGKPLSTLEKLKNRLIYLTEKLNSPIEDKVKLRRTINDAWGEIYSTLASNENFILPEDEFLSAHLSLYRKPIESTFSENAAEIKVFQMFCNRSEKYELDESGKFEEPISYGKIEEYVIRISGLAPIWADIHNSKNDLLKHVLILESRKEVKIFLSAVIIKAKSDGAILNRVLEDLERVLFRNRIPGVWLMDERTLASWARELYKDEISLEDILESFRKLLSEPIINSKVVQSFKALFLYERGAKGFHRWPALKYFLFEYEEFLRVKAKEESKKLSIDEYFNTTIEHIIPQQYSDFWSAEVEDFTATLQDESIDQAKKILLNTLGNLTLLKHGKNASLGNRSWKEKKERFRTGSYNEIDVSNNEFWNKSNIAHRGKEMLLFLQTKVQGLVFSQDEINDLLFVNEEVKNSFLDLSQS